MRIYEDARNNFKTVLRAYQTPIFRNSIILGVLYSHFILKSFVGRQNNSNGPHANRYAPV